MTIQAMLDALKAQMTESDVMTDNCMIITEPWINVNQPARVLVYQNGIEIAAGDVFWDGEQMRIEWDTSND